MPPIRWIFLVLIKKVVCVLSLLLRLSIQYTGNCACLKTLLTITPIHVDKSYKKVMNFIFYFLIGCVVLTILGVDPFVFILSISTLLESFAFMIGSGISQQFEGILLVLARQPYDLGDGTAIVRVCWDFC